MDPFSALSVAGNVVQFVDFMSGLISTSRELYKSANGTLSVNGDLEITTKDLIQICDGLIIRPRDSVEDSNSFNLECALVPLCKSCKQLGEELLELLQKLRVKGRHKKLMSVQQALRSVCKGSKIRCYQQRLGEFRSQITIHLIGALQSRGSPGQVIAANSETKELVSGQSRIAQALNELATRHRRLEIATIDEVSSLRKEILISLSGTHLWNSDQPSEAVHGPSSNLETKLWALSKQAPALSKDLDLLDGLCFPTIYQRQVQIAEAHPGTYDWLFDPSATEDGPHGEHSRISILEWLEKHHGIYWLSGKAGSGKSTLMKYLFNHDRTLAALKKWAGEKQLLTSHHFFWNAGTGMQKSQQGLLQTLLYHILRQCPSLIRDTCPSWLYGNDLRRKIWTRTDLLYALKTLAKGSISSANFCFFIDGLDEYDGDHKDIIDIIEIFASTSAIKLIVSSRPWLVFEESFGNNAIQHIKVQNFTRPDIELFVTEKLADDPRFKELDASDCRYKDLITEIVDRADGVFLWVFLVVRSLRRGLTNSDTVLELQQRLRMLPTDLEVYFKHMLDSVERLYHEQAARLFLIRLASPALLTVMIASYFDEKETDFALTTTANDSRPRSSTDLERTERRTSKRVKARCSDLLEISEDYSIPGYLGTFNIDFLHRTVRDFLETKDIQHLLLERAGLGFNADRYLCNALLSHMKSLPRTLDLWTGPEIFAVLVNGFMNHAYRLDVSHGFIYKSLIEDLQASIEFFHKNRSPFCWNIMDVAQADSRSESEEGWPFSCLSGSISHQLQEGWMIHLAAYYGLYGHICDKESQLPSLITCKNARAISPLASALRLVSGLVSKKMNYTPIDPRIICMILSHGADPNDRYEDEPIWYGFLRDIRYETRDPDWKRRGVTIMEILIRHGARVTLTMKKREFEYRLSRFCTPKEIEYLVDLLYDVKKPFPQLPNKPSKIPKS